jgi:hypothetical protein
MNHIEWGEGPWNNEEDHYVWIDPVTDLDCMINRGPSGALCGYVGVGPDHPMHGVHYDQTDYDVHGGLTYSNSCQEDGEICHVPAEGREHDIWWLGFDCAHGWDVMPKMDADLRELRTRVPAFPELAAPFDDPRLRSTYKDVDYVRREVMDLAWQLYVKGVEDGAT